MDYKHVFSTEIKPATTNDAIQDSESQACKILKCYSEKRNNAQNDESTQSVINSENVSLTYIETSDEDDAFERLSIDIDQMENQIPFMTDLESSIDCEKKCAITLHERAQRLWSEMMNVREKLNKETSLWKKEREEFQFLRERSDVLAFEEATAAARAAAVAYAVESPLSNDLSNIVDITSEKSIRELAILEYEKNLAKYQDPYSFEQADQRYNSYKRALVEAYQQKLSEVERLCNKEMENICQSASCLQPFKEIASQWSIDENDHGDSQRDCIDRPDAEHSKITETNFNNDWCISTKINNEINMIPEILSTQFKREEAI